MSFSAHLPVLLPQRESDQLAPLPWPSASIRRGTSTPSFFANVRHSKFATMQAHSSMLLMLLVIWPAPTSPTWSTSLLKAAIAGRALRSEEHTSELQSHVNLVCRLLLEKKKKKKQ